MVYANGDQYKGTWLHDLRHGNGACQYANNDSFVGNFVENMREGWGVYTAAPMRMLKHNGMQAVCESQTSRTFDGHHREANSQIHF